MAMITTVDFTNVPDEGGYYVTTQLEGLDFQTQQYGNRMEPYGWSIPVEKKGAFEAMRDDDTIMVHVVDNYFTASRRRYVKAEMEEVKVVDGERVIGHYVRERRPGGVVEFIWTPAV